MPANVCSKLAMDPSLVVIAVGLVIIAANLLIGIWVAIWTDSLKKELAHTINDTTALTDLTNELSPLESSALFLIWVGALTIIAAVITLGVAQRFRELPISVYGIFIGLIGGTILLASGITCSVFLGNLDFSRWSKSHARNLTSCALAIMATAFAYDVLILLVIVLLLLFAIFGCCRRCCIRKQRNGAYSQTAA